MTRADKIRNMTDEELKEFLQEWGMSMYGVSSFPMPLNVLEWLRSPIDDEITVGTVLWEMRGIRENGKIKWYASPWCVEKINEHMYLSAYGTGTSKNGIGKNTFLSRNDALDNFLKSHESLEEYIDIDKSLPKELLGNVVEKPRTDFEDIRIYPSYTMEQIIHIFIDGMHVPENAFHWERTDPESAAMTGCYCSLTLNQLSTQYYANHKHGIITVVVEGPLKGEIYQIGNHKEMKWEKHGTTNGYA